MTNIYQKLCSKVILEVWLYNIMKYYIYNSSNYCSGFNAEKKLGSKIIGNLRTFVKNKKNNTSPLDHWNEGSKKIDDMPGHLKKEK